MVPLPEQAMAMAMADTMAETATMGTIRMVSAEMDRCGQARGPMDLLDRHTMVTISENMQCDGWRESPYNLA